MAFSNGNGSSLVLLRMVVQGCGLILCFVWPFFLELGAHATSPAMRKQAQAEFRLCARLSANEP